MCSYFFPYWPPVIGINDQGEARIAAYIKRCSISAMANY
jgi:hypothetical protein